MIDNKGDLYAFIAILAVGGLILSCFFIGVAALASGPDTLMSKDQQRMEEIQNKTAAMINSARNQEMDGAVRLAEAISGNGGGIMGGGSGGNDGGLAVIGLVGVLGLILSFFVFMAKKG